MLPRLGCAAPEDTFLLPAHLAGATLPARLLAPALQAPDASRAVAGAAPHVSSDATAAAAAALLRAEAAAARAAIEAAALDDAAWAVPRATGADVYGAGTDGSAEAAQPAAVEAVTSTLEAIVRRALWVGPAPERAVGVDTLLGAALDVRPGCNEIS